MSGNEPFPPNFKGQAKLKTKADLHLPRKLWHFLGVMCIIYLYRTSTRSDALQLAFTLTAVFLAIDGVRLLVPTINSVVCRVFGPIMRERERNRLAGTSWLMVGVSLIVIFFQMM